MKNSTIKETKIKLTIISEQIYELMPWKYIEATDCMLVLLEKSVVYFSVYAYKDEKYIICFFNDEDYFLYRRLCKQKAKKQYEQIPMTSHINAMACRYSNKGANTEFIVCEEGFVPRQIGDFELKRLYEAFTHIIMILRHIYDGTMRPDFKNNFVARKYNEPSKLWFNEEMSLDVITQRENSILAFEYSDEMEKLRNDTKIPYRLELEADYINVKLKDKRNREFYPYFITIIDSNSGFAYYTKYCEPKYNKINAVLDAFADVCSEIHKPKIIKIKNNELARFMKDFCENADIELKIQKEMSKTDDLRKHIFIELAFENGAIREYDKNKSYIINISLLNVDYDCSRKIRISADATLYDLHKAIIESIKFDDDHGHEFFLNDKLWSDTNSYSSHRYSVSEFLTKDFHIGELLDKKQNFKYVYDFGACWMFQCKVIDIIDEPTTKPVISSKIGKSPKQYRY